MRYGYNLTGLPEPRCPECGAPTSRCPRARRRKVNDATPIHALLDHHGNPNGSTLDLLAKADCVIAVDVMTETEAVVWGRAWLQGIVDSRQPKDGRVLRIELDSGTGELETLLELVRRVHGRHDYKAKP